MLRADRLQEVAVAMAVTVEQELTPLAALRPEFVKWRPETEVADLASRAENARDIAALDGLLAIWHVESQH